MPDKPTQKGATVLSYLGDERWENLPKLTLAKKIYSDHPTLFKDVENVRSIIRFYRGTTGTKQRQFCSDKSFFDNRYHLPDSDEQEFFPFKLPNICKNILMLSDLHIPYHSVEAINIALEYGEKKNIDTIFLNGDVFDFYQASRFMKDPRKRRFKDELDAGREFLQILREHFPNAYIFFKPGNHEERWEHYLMLKAPELLDMTEFRLDIIMRFGELNIKTITVPKQIVSIGALTVLHGHEYGGSYRSPVNPARGLYLKAKRSCIAGHHHQTSEHTEGDIHSEITTCWSLGCLSELHPEYLPLNKWNWGFAHISVDGDYFEVDNLRIVEYKVV